MAFYDFYNYKSMVFFYNGVYRTHNSWNDIIFFYFNTTWKTKKIGKKVHFINCFWRVKIKRKMGIFKKNKGKTFKNRENSTNTEKIKKQKENQWLSNTKVMKNWFKQKEKREKTTKINYFHTARTNHAMNTQHLCWIFSKHCNSKWCWWWWTKQPMPTMTLFLFMVLFSWNFPIFLLNEYFIFLL